MLGAKSLPRQRHLRAHLLQEQRQDPPRAADHALVLRLQQLEQVRHRQRDERPLVHQLEVPVPVKVPRLEQQLVRQRPNRLHHLQRRQHLDLALLVAQEAPQVRGEDGEEALGQRRAHADRARTAARRPAGRRLERPRHEGVAGRVAEPLQRNPPQHRALAPGEHVEHLRHAGVHEGRRHAEGVDHQRTPELDRDGVEQPHVPDARLELVGVGEGCEEARRRHHRPPEGHHRRAGHVADLQKVPVDVEPEVDVLGDVDARLVQHHRHQLQPVLPQKPLGDLEDQRSRLHRRREHHAVGLRLQEAANRRAVPARHRVRALLQEAQQNVPHREDDVVHQLQRHGGLGGVPHGVLVHQRAHEHLVHLGALYRPQAPEHLGHGAVRLDHADQRRLLHVRRDVLHHRQALLPLQHQAQHRPPLQLPATSLLLRRRLAVQRLGDVLRRHPRERLGPREHLRRVVQRDQLQHLHLLEDSDGVLYLVPQGELDLRVVGQLQ
ncbi:DUF4347 domain-containing protein [Babesia caballi]|uniref:DUF4347 domain-containing protein n=1 Tax=Babesia caballi TaxID=5871 RepID=A0AAV4LT75_BABCB|nr:DUF4347 domain-containing protein [Babesia caballi]